MTRIAIFALSLFTYACAPPATPADLDSNCPTRPDIEDCSSGALWAECGGTGSEPVFACRPSDARCYWFANGCAAQDFEVSPCAADDVCCVADGFPFEPNLFSDAPQPGVYGVLYGWGTEPWDRTRDRNIEVVTTAATEEASSVSCTGGDLGAPCGASTPEIWVSRSFNGELMVTVQPVGPTFSGWSLTVEVIRDQDSSLHARACRIPFTDSVNPTMCPDSSPDCATEGTIELEAFPTSDEAAASMPLHLVATFADGTVLDAHL